jgi:hypothetical protein
MATYIDLDSLHRDRENYPNENDYTVTASQVETWFTSARTIRALPANPILSIKEFVTTINIRDLALPYSDELAALPRIYIEFRSETYKDIRLINTIGGIHADTHFVCSPKRIQTDSNDIPIWIHYECHMEQTMRFERGRPVRIQFTSRNGNVLPQQDTSPLMEADPNKQTLITFEITPYIRDGTYDNHMVETVTS